MEQKIKSMVAVMNPEERGEWLKSRVEELVARLRRQGFDDEEISLALLGPGGGLLIVAKGEKYMANFLRLLADRQEAKAESGYVN